MTKRLFAIVKITEPKKMAELIEAKFMHSLKLTDDQWLIAGELTVMEVARALRIGDDRGEDEEYGSAIVLGVHAYYGRASEHVWDWMRVKSDV